MGGAVHGLASGDELERLVKSRSDDLPRNRRTSAFERRVASVLEAHLSQVEHVVVACSGGPDSVAALIATVRNRPSGSVTAVYFDHQLRQATETEGDVAFVAEMANRLGACFVSGVPSVPLAGDEASAREARYRCLAEMCAAHGAAVCVTGHTEDDQAETVLLRLARGSGLRGAGGMHVRASWPTSGILDAFPELLRPLLAVSRAEIEGYLGVLGIDARLDPTNELVIYARNRVRSRVIPELEQFNSRAKRHLAAFAERAQLDDEALEAWAEHEFEEHATVEDGVVNLTRSALRPLLPAINTRVVRLAARKIGIELTSEQLAGALTALGRTGYAVSVEGGEVRSGPLYLVVRRFRSPIT